MIDHILVFPDATAREAAWPPPVDSEGNPTGASSWSVDGRAIVPVRIIHARATHDSEGAILSPEVAAPGSWLVIRTPRRDPEMEALSEAVIVTDANAAAAGAPYVIKCSLAPETLLGQVDPVWAGSHYSIPVGLPVSSLDEWRIA